MGSFTDDLNNPLPKQMQSEMMDDVRPSSSPTNDCAASNSRRIEGRPATALRPSSERLGRVTLKRGTLAFASKVVSSEEPFLNLSNDILEQILARLSLFSLVAAKKVCKQWELVTSTPEFDILRKELNPKPCLVRYGIDLPDPSDSQCFAYDVENNAWVTLPGLQLPTHHRHKSITGASGVVFAVSGPGQDRLLYKLTSTASSAESFGETWYETPVMTFPRFGKPVVSVAVGDGMGHKVVVAGGGAHPSFNDTVEVFHSKSGTWESYGELPDELKEFDCQELMSGVVCDNKLYVLGIFNSKNEQIQIHFLDLYTKQWASIQLEHPKDLVLSRIMAIETTLVVAGSCYGKTKDHLVVKLWKVDLKILTLIQIGLLSSELFALLGEPNSLWMLKPLTFQTDENLVYVYIYGRLVMAEVSLEECKTSWRLLPKIMGEDCLMNRYITFLASIRHA